MSDEWVRGNWMQTYTGLRFYPTAPSPDDVVIEDIAHALSLICRYGGHVDRFYSVAEHCLLLSHYVAPEHAEWALLHDATEAYVGDMVRPLKLQIPQYRVIEDHLMAVIATRFDMAGDEIPDEVKSVDSRILLDERASLMPATRYPWDVEDQEPLGVEVRGLPSAEVERLYLERFDEIRGAA
jgi:hypothetical protein